MRRHALPLNAAVICLGACLWAQPTSADEAKSSWTAKLWPGSWLPKKVPEGKKDGRGEPVKEGKDQAEQAQRLRAEQDWERRAEVCQKLRQIAFDTNDEELERLADRLDQRAWDLYLKRSGGAPAVSLDERVLAERVGIDFNLLSPAPTKQPRRAEEIRETP